MMTTLTLWFRLELRLWISTHPGNLFIYLSMCLFSSYLLFCVFFLYSFLLILIHHSFIHLFNHSRTQTGVNAAKCLHQCGTSILHSFIHWLVHHSFIHLFDHSPAQTGVNTAKSLHQCGMSWPTGAQIRQPGPGLQKWVIAIGRSKNWGVPCLGMAWTRLLFLVNVWSVHIIRQSLKTPRINSWHGDWGGLGPDCRPRRLTHE